MTPVRFDEVFLAAACVYNETQCERNVCTARKERDLLRDGVLEDFEVILCEARGQRALCISRRECYVDQVDIHADLRWFLAPRVSHQRGQDDGCAHSVD